MKNQRTEPKKVFVVVIFILSLLLAFVGFRTFYIGFHNIDLGSNMRYLETALDIELQDLGSDGKLRDGGEVFSLGMKYIQQGFAIILVSIFICGLTFWEIARRYSKNG